MSEFSLPKLPITVCDGDYTGFQVKEYGIACAKAVLEEVAVRMRNNADKTVAKWEEIGDDEDIIHAKSAAFSVYVHAASIRKFADEIEIPTE